MKLGWLAAGFLVCLAAVGLPFWVTPYGELSVPDVFIVPGLLVVVPVAAALRFFSVAPVLIVVAVLTGAMVLANIIRIEVDLAADPTTHNLFPLEIAMTLVVGSLLALAGCVAAILGGALLRLTGWYDPR